MKTFIGCSGYYYNHWKGVFYPEDLPKYKWLSYYSENFKTVEINNTFYKMPEEKALKRWYDITPDDFVFSVKGYRYITHMKKLLADEVLIDYLTLFQRTVSTLRKKTGPLLWQLPGSLKVNLKKLEKFCSLLSTDFHHVFEFRDQSWFIQEVFDLLSKYNHDICIVSGPGNIPEITRVTSGIAYIRFHGKGSWYSDEYSNESLDKWKERLVNIHASQLYAYFNNDVNAFAIKNGKYFASLFNDA